MQGRVSTVPTLGCPCGGDLFFERLEQGQTLTPSDPSATASQLGDGTSLRISWPVCITLEACGEGEAGWRRRTLAHGGGHMRPLGAVLSLRHLLGTIPMPRGVWH